MPKILKGMELRKEIYKTIDKIKENDERGLSNKKNYDRMIKLEKIRDKENA